MYKNMTELLDEKEINGWKLEKFEITCKNFIAILDGILPGTYIRLVHDGECVMSDTGMEKRTNLKFCSKAHGDIIIGGLGIGMIIMAIQDKPEVRSITVIEKNQEVIDLVTSQIELNDKVKIVHADVFDWYPEKGVKYDMSYMDIWNCVNETVYRKEMLPLKRKYARFLRSKNENPYRFNECWAEYQAKNNKRLA